VSTLIKVQNTVKNSLHTWLLGLITEYVDPIDHK
jgi:hypothetical protein